MILGIFLAILILYVFYDIILHIGYAIPIIKKTFNRQKYICITDYGSSTATKAVGGKIMAITIKL